MVSILDVLYPKRCFACGKFGTYICMLCRKKILVLEKDVCPYCEKSSLLGWTHPRCQRDGGVDGLRSVYIYGFVIQKIIKSIKYRSIRGGIKEILKTFPKDKVTSITDYYQEMSDAVILPVPLHKNRIKMRGFNQSTEIARHLGPVIGIPIRQTLVQRTRETFPQAQLQSRQERFQNIRGAFSLNLPAGENAPPTVIIVDDVWTSGSTMKEIARVLKRNGVQKVLAFTIARQNRV